MKILELEQRTPEWYVARKGIPTASSFDRIVTSEGKPSKQRTKYLYELVGERLGGIIDESYQSFSMIQGVEKESEARALYELIHEPVKEVGFCISDCGKFGCSPDGLIGDHGGVEIKCPLMSTHIEYLLKYKEEMPTDYYQQVQGSLFVTGRQWWDFVSYFPGLPPLIVREEPNETFQRLLKQELEFFCQEIDEIVRKLSL